jgi:predicted DNA-binding ribbon-helix-helix protein
MISGLGYWKLPSLVARIDKSRKTVNLSSAIPMFFLKYFKPGRKRKSSRRKKR